MPNEGFFQNLAQAVIDGLPERARALAEEALRAGIDPLDAIEQGFKPGMDVVGDGFAKCGYICSYAIILLSAAGGDAKSGYNFIKYQQTFILVGQLPNSL